VSELKVILEYLQSQPIAIVLMVVIWWLFRRLKEQDSSIKEVWHEFGKLNESINKLAITIGELTAIIKVCCTNGRRKY